MQKQVNFSNQTRVLRLYILKTSVAASPTENRSVNLKREEFMQFYRVSENRVWNVSTQWPGGLGRTGSEPDREGLRWVGPWLAFLTSCSDAPWTVLVALS